MRSSDAEQRMALPQCFQQEFVDASKLPHAVPASPTPVTKSCADVIHFMKGGKVKKAKNIVRTQHWPIDHPHRAQLWLKLCQEHMKEAVPLDFYHNTVKESLGGLWPQSLPVFADPRFCEDYLLTEEGQRRAERVLYVVTISHPFITYCPILHPVTCLLLHYLSEEQAYECVCALLDGTVVRHANQTRLMHEASTHTLMRLTKHLAKPTYARLVHHVRREDETERIFRAWQLWIFRGLPFYHLVRTTDCFLMEGVRALYRIAMAILILYVKDHSAEYPTQSLFSRVFGIRTGRNRADSVREGGRDLGEFPSRIIAFCKEMTYNVDKLLKTAYSIQGMSGKLLSQQMLKSEAYIRSRYSVRRRASSEGAVSATGCRTEVMEPHVPDKNCGRGPTRAVSIGIIPLANFRSEVLTAAQISAVCNWLPPRITTLRPEVIYSTNRHGTSLTHLYLRTENREPTVLAILTSRGDRFGAYCSTRWQERRRSSFFGTGETFLFTFVPEPRRFEWVGVNSVLDVPHSSKLFLSANQHMIQIGAGNGMGLYIDGSLENGRTEHCDTFDNAPLASSKDFVIRILEVVGFV